MLLGIISCNYRNKQHTAIPLVKTGTEKPREIKYVRYNTPQLISFLDSVGKLPTQPLADKASFLADSIFYNQLQLNQTVSTNNFVKLKDAAMRGFIDIETAKTIFKDKKTDSICINDSLIAERKKGMIPLVFYSFDNNKDLFSEFAICLGDQEHCENTYLYFFKGRKIISKHFGYNHYGLELKYYKDIDNKNVIYYKVQFVRGAGNWWQQYFFYKYADNKLIPILNELQNGNIGITLGNRILWLESSIKKTNPLTVKMVYNDHLPDTTKDDLGPMFIQDSTLVQYVWDEKQKRLIGQYSKSKLTKPQILSYNLSGNDLLFINTHYKVLKASLFDKSKKSQTLSYLTFVKNQSR